MPLFTGKVALITGGTQGVGRATAVARARAGAAAVVAWPGDGAGRETARPVQEAGASGLSHGLRAAGGYTAQ